MPGVIPSELSRFEVRYGIGAAVMLAVEREALGTDHGANGYTGIDEADLIGDRLALSSDTTLLDLGSGCGWPGLYLAHRFGCRLVSADPVASGVARSVDRARSDGLADRHLAVVADGADLPIRGASIDALVHVDVLC